MSDRKYGGQLHFVDSQGRFVRPIGKHDVTLPDGTIWVPEGLLIRFEEYGPAPFGGRIKKTVLAPGQTIRVISWGDPYQRASWEVVS